MKEVAIITPFVKSLTQTVVEYMEASGIEVVDSISLKVAASTVCKTLKQLQLRPVVPNAGRLLAMDRS